MDQIEFRKRMRAGEVMTAARSLLLMNYHLNLEEAGGLIEATDPETIKEAVVDCLTAEGQAPRTYSAWVRSALLANGLKPEDVPPEDLTNVLRQLEKTGRIEPWDSFSAAAEGARFREELGIGV